MGLWYSEGKSQASHGPPCLGLSPLQRAVNCPLPSLLASTTRLQNVASTLSPFPHLPHASTHCNLVAFTVINKYLFVLHLMTQLNPFLGFTIIYDTVVSPCFYNECSLALALRPHSPGVVVNPWESAHATSDLLCLAVIYV